MHPASLITDNEKLYRRGIADFCCYNPNLVASRAGGAAVRAKAADSQDGCKNREHSDSARMAGMAKEEMMKEGRRQLTFTQRTPDELK
jgi:hypothetical protein